MRQAQRHCGTSQSTLLNLTLSRLRHCSTSHSTQFTLCDVNRAKPTFVHFGTAASVANINAPLWTGIEQSLQLRKSSKQDMEDHVIMYRCTRVRALTFPVVPEASTLISAAGLYHCRETNGILFFY